MITHVAIKFNGKLWSLPQPYRHHHIIKMIVMLGEAEYVDTERDEQGFLDDTGKYLTREEAFLQAMTCCQIKEGSVGLQLGWLSSEDVW